MTTATKMRVDAEPILFQLWFREHAKGSRWKKAGRASTHAEAIAMIGGRGDWHIAPLYDAALAGATGDARQSDLFDEPRGSAT